MDERTKEQLQLGRKHYQKGEYERAERALTEVLNASDQYADAHNMLGFILHSRGDLAGAERCFERAVELNPRYTEALLNLAVAYNDLGKYEASRQIYAKMQKPGAQPGVIDPFMRGKIANMHADVAQAYLEASAPAEAILEMKKAVALGPSFPDLWARLGSIHRDMGDIEQARDAYETALRAAPKYVHARILLGVTLLSMRDQEGAISAFREALALEPESRSAKVYLRIAEGQRAKATSAQGAAGDGAAGDGAAGDGAAGDGPAARPAPSGEARSVTIPPPPSASPGPLLDSIDLDPLSRGSR